MLADSGVTRHGVGECGHHGRRGERHLFRLPREALCGLQHGQADLCVRRPRGAGRAEVVEDRRHPAGPQRLRLETVLGTPRVRPAARLLLGGRHSSRVGGGGPSELAGEGREVAAEGAKYSFA